MSEITTRLWWVRHAPVDHGGRIYGQLDLPCDCSATDIFIGLATQLPRDAVWVTSNLRRTHETAAAIIRAGLPGPKMIPGPEAVAIDGLAEQDFGEWQGLAYEDLHRLRADDFPRFWHAQAHEAAPGGESFLAVIERVSRAVHELVQMYSGRDVIAVAHGGTIRAALAQALGLEPETALAFTIENCSITRINHMKAGYGSRLARRHGQPPIPLTHRAR